MTYKRKWQIKYANFAFSVVNHETINREVADLLQKITIWQRRWKIPLNFIMAADMEISQTVRLGYPFLVVSLVTVDCNEDFHAIELVFIIYIKVQSYFK